MPGAGAEQVLSKVPALSSNPHNDALLKTKLRLEAELEGCRELPLPEISHEGRKERLLELAEQHLHDTQRTLLYYTDMSAALDAKLGRLDACVQSCEQIKAMLEPDQEAHTEESQLLAITQRQQDCTKFFNAFRRVFKKVLYDVDEQTPKLDVSSVLQELCNQLLDEPNNPYVEMDDLNCDAATLNFLITNNLVQRHSHYSTQIKLLDPRT